MFSARRSPSLELIASLPLTPTTTSSLDMIVSPPHSDPLSLSETVDVNSCPSNRKRGRYYLPAENVVFLVENELYSVHRYFFQHYSSHFAAMFSENEGKGSTDDSAIPLEGVTIAAFDLFLSLLYPAEFTKYTATTVTEWAAILDLATQWKFESIRVLAIHQLALIASPIDRIVFGHKYSIPEWLSDAYHAICSRPDPLTEEEGIRLGIRDTIKISAIRQAYGTSKPRFLSTFLLGDLDKIFGLTIKAAKPPVESEGECTLGTPLNEKKEDPECIPGNDGLDGGEKAQQLVATASWNGDLFSSFGSCTSGGFGVTSWGLGGADRCVGVEREDDSKGYNNNGEEISKNSKPLSSAQKKKQAKQEKEAKREEARQQCKAKEQEQEQAEQEKARQQREAEEQKMEREQTGRVALFF